MAQNPVEMLNAALDRALVHSPFLRKQAERLPQVAERLAAGDLDGALNAARKVEPGLPAETRLRRQRAGLALALGVGDLAGLLSMEEVTGALSRFADEALDLAIAAAMEQVVPGAGSTGFAAIALGKLGGSELNYSSDLDPILIFDPETMPHRARDEPVETAVRIARKLIEILQARDGEGYVFRIDLRLRPNPDVTPIALPVEAAISYYESSALAWERSAFVRARACAGDIALGKGFLEAISPFVWRRGLDFGTIKEMRAMTSRIREHHAQGQRLGPGFDLKRGRGGIREVEFFAQIHQMIHGGRDPSLRVPTTLDALAALAAAGRIGGEEARELSGSYRTLRTLEHRLQMVDDQQTHALPRDADALDNVARLHGLADGAALIDLLAPVCDSVATHYDSLERDGGERLPEDAERLGAALSAAGFADPVAAAQRIAHWRSGTVPAVRTPAARAAFEDVLPALVEALGKAPDANGAIVKLSNLVERLPSAVNLFRLLEAQPALRDLLIRIVSHAPTLAGPLERRPELLDTLIDATAFRLPGGVAQLAAAFAMSGALEDRLDFLRRQVGDLRFALGVQLIEGASDPLDIAQGYARVAEAAIAVAADAAIAEFEGAHGKVPGGELAILALGRMGGAELTHASDLDLIYLFTGDFAAESDGSRPLGATLYFNRLAQRVTAGLSVATAAGPLYDVDTRLRPSGNQGPLSVSFDAFERYQKEEAWTWEHMALTRARPVYGSLSARAALQAIIDSVLAQKREPAALRADAVKMRADIAAHKPQAGPLDVKLGDGGLIDLEFAVHVAQLQSGEGHDPRLAVAIERLVEKGLLPGEMAEAHRLLTRVLVAARLVAPDGQFPPDVTRPILANACAMPDWDALIAALAATREAVARCWTEISGG